MDEPPQQERSLIDLLPGQVLFGKYRVEKKLGEGGMGTVWLVHHLALNVDRALKVIRPEVAADPLIRARFQREGRVMARLSHPGAVVVYDAWMEDDAAFIVMEFVTGRSLNQCLRPGVPMPLDWVIEVLKQFCDVLQAAHDRGIVHRDLKPSNLMLVEDQPGVPVRLKVLDFGIAKFFSPGETTTGDAVLTQTEARAFTPAYASPEQIKGEPVDARSDLYSVGVMLYEFLTGHRPFGGPSVCYDQVATPPPPFSVLNPEVMQPEAVERVVLRCLAKAPADRPQSADELLREFLAALPRPPQPSPAASEPPQAGRWRRLALLAALAVVSGLALLAILFVFVRPPKPLVPTGYTIPDEAAWVDGRPLAIVCAATGVRYERSAGGPYLPEGYEIEPSSGQLNGWPRALRGTGDRRRYVLYTEGYYVPEGFRAESGGSLRVTGQPTVLVREADGKRFELGGQTIYIPEGYEAKPGAPPVRGRPPVAIIRKGDGTRFVWIAGGRFMMGALGPWTGRPPDGEDQPPHPVTVPGVYLQDAEVTNAEMGAFFRQQNLDPAEEAPAFALAYAKLSKVRKPDESGRHPAVGITHRTAERYAAWAGGRLPAEAEWEYAARSRGRPDRPFVWGDTPLSAADVRQRRVNLEWSGQDMIPTRPVKQSPLDRTEQGAFDLAGNVREWCLDYWCPYPGPLAGASGGDQPVVPEDSQTREYVLRGGSYRMMADAALTTRPRRLGDDDTDRDGKKVSAAPDIGFRIVIEPVPVPGVGL